MRMLVVLWFVAGCGRFGFGNHASENDGGGSDAATSDAVIDVPIDANLGDPCTADVQCGKCARCEQTCQPEPVVAMFVGHRSTCYVGAGRVRWCTGENNDGQLGLGDVVNRSTPTRSDDGGGWDRMNLFYYGEALAVRQGQFFEWGNGTLAPVAIGPSRDVKATLGDLSRKCFWEADGTAATCAGAGATVWRSLDYGAGHFCGVRASDRTLWCWGTSYSNALGMNVADGTTIANATQVGTDTDWDHVGVGGKDAGPSGLVGVSCAMKTNGAIYCFGDPSLTGTNGTNVGATPTQIGTGWTWVDVDWQHACAGKSDESVWCWGADTYGGYVVPGAMSAAVPTRIPGTYQRWLMGGHHACGLTNGMWRCMGWNGQGQLGDGTTSGTGELVDFCPAQ